MLIPGSRLAFALFEGHRRRSTGEDGAETVAELPFARSRVYSRSRVANLQSRKVPSEEGI